MSTVTGTIAAGAPVNTSHEEPANVTISGTYNGGQNVTQVLGGYKNTGNVPQTLTVNGISNAVKCTFVSAKILLSGTPVDPPQNVFVLQPGVTVAVEYKVHLDDQGIGAPETTFSFDTNVSWS